MTDSAAASRPAYRGDPIAIAGAMLLPPLGLYRVAGPGRDFFIACALTAFGFLPGMAFALHQILLGQPR